MEKLKTRVKGFKPVVWILLLVVALFGALNQRYLSVSNFQNILQQSSPLMVLSFAQTLIILMQGTDLSLGAQVSFCTILFVFFATMGVPVWLCCLVVLLCTTLIGAANGFVVSRLQVPTFIATLGMQYILRSVSLLVCNGKSIYYSSEIIQNIASGIFAGIPYMTWIAAVTFLAAWLMLNRTRMGANTIALGGNPEALKVAGVNLAGAQIKTWMFAGFLAGIAGLLVVCRVESGQPAAGDGMEFNAIAAALLGGTSMREGKGGLGGTVFGVLLIYALKNGLNLSGLSSMYHNAILGSVILLSIVIDALISRANKQEV